MGEVSLFNRHGRGVPAPHFRLWSCTFTGLSTFWPSWMCATVHVSLPSTAAQLTHVLAAPTVPSHTCTQGHPYGFKYDLNTINTSQDTPKCDHFIQYEPEKIARKVRHASLEP